jgi:hypothetical protein
MPLAPRVRAKASLSDLTAPQQQLVRLLQRVNFGRIENLLIVAGEPVFRPRPRTVHAIKIGGANGPRAEAALDDFPLTDPIKEMLSRIGELRDGRVERIDVRHGLPFAMEIEQSESPA